MTDASESRNDKIVSLTAEVISAYVANNAVPASQLPALIAHIYRSLSELGTAPAQKEEPQKPAVNPKRSVHDDYIVCLEDGNKFKSLKRHLMSHHGISPEEYREKWNLRPDYPMIAPGYAAKRSDLAKKMGLGRKPGQAAAARKMRATRRNTGD